MKVDEITSGIRKKDQRSLAKAITLIEKHAEEGREIIKNIYDKKKKSSHIIGITGFPGVGKSTLVSRITEKYRKQGKTVGIVAIDPASPFTGGALLGDRLRLSGHDTGSGLWTDPGVFYRSVTTGGRAGGIPRVTGDIITLISAYGFDKIIVETAGAGQSEVDVVKVVDTSVVVLMPGAGDRIQFGKAGILEIADIFAVNKSDLEGATRVEQFLKEMISQEESVKESDIGDQQKSKGGHCTRSTPYREIEIEQRGDKNHWIPPIVMTIGKREKIKGIDEFIKAIKEHKNYLNRSGNLRETRKKRAKKELETVVGNMIVETCQKDFDIDLNDYADKVANEEIDQYSAAEEILEKIMQNSKN